MAPHAPQREPEEGEGGDQRHDALRPPKASRDAVSLIRMKKYVQGQGQGQSKHPGLSI